MKLVIERRPVPWGIFAVVITIGFLLGMVIGILDCGAHP